MSQRKLGQFELAGMLIEVSILILGLVLISGFVRDFWRPHEQIATANVVALHHAIEQVCATGQERTINFEMPQPVAFYTELGGFWTGSPLNRKLLPRFQIRAQGDPQFLLYYQTLSPVYGLTGWDYYFDLPRRAFVYIQGDAEIPNGREYLRTLETSAKARIGEAEVIFPNLLLGREFLGSLGNWEDSFYKFNKTLGTELDKSSSKYRACGKGLCYKTRRGVQKLDLNCNLPVIALSESEPVDIPIPEFLPPFEGKYVDEHVDFNVASPCKAPVEVERTTCECSALRWRLWELRDDKLVPITEPQIHCVGEEYADDVADIGPDTEFECLRINFGNPSTYCLISSHIEYLDKQTKTPNIIATLPTKETRDAYGVALNSWPSR